MQSDIRTMSLECAKVGGINLSQGVCDTDVPLPVRRGAQEAMDAGRNIYTPYNGLPELRQALAQKLQRAGISADPDREITVTAGATGAFYCACRALLNVHPDRTLLRLSSANAAFAWRCAALCEDKSAGLGAFAGRARGRLLAQDARDHA
jgi:histidinol-phosphate/aromatic aminotransferase/cobyric acid decarboxylase-like protein